MSDCWPTIYEIVVFRHGVRPDAQLYSSLICIAGRAHHVDLAFELQTDMIAQGQQPSEVQHSWHTCLSSATFCRCCKYNRSHDAQLQQYASCSCKHLCIYCTDQQPLHGVKGVQQGRCSTSQSALKSTLQMLWQTSVCESRFGCRPSIQR